jgi:hypothetical protein
MTDTWPLILAVVCFVTAAAAFLNVCHTSAVKRSSERLAYATAVYATESQLEAMPVEHLLDLRARLSDFAEREQGQLDTFIAVERLDRIITAKDTGQLLAVTA